MQTVEKQAIPIVIDENNNPIAVVYFNKGRDRIIYMLKKANEDEIVALLTPTNESKHGTVLEKSGRNSEN